MKEEEGLGLSRWTYVNVSPPLSLLIIIYTSFVGAWQLTISKGVSSLAPYLVLLVILFNSLFLFRPCFVILFCFY